MEGSAAKDYWEYDPTKSSWTRFIVVPRADFFHPGEGGGGQKKSEMKDLSCRACEIADGPFLMEYDQSKTVGEKKLENWRLVETWRNGLGKSSSSSDGLRMTRTRIPRRPS